MYAQSSAKRIDPRALWVAVNQEVDLVGQIWSHVVIDVSRQAVDVMKEI